jgi:hypothetical protein
MPIKFWRTVPQNFKPGFRVKFFLRAFVFIAAIVTRFCFGPTYKYINLNKRKQV